VVTTIRSLLVGCALFGHHQSLVQPGDDEQLINMVSFLWQVVITISSPLVNNFDSALMTFYIAGILLHPVMILHFHNIC
jgi:hypothetical protein